MLLVQSQMSNHKIASNADLPHLVSAWAGFSISPQVISTVDTDLGQRSVIEGIEAVLRRIEYCHQGSINTFKIMCQDDKGFWLFRCFLWLVWELAKVWDSQVELAGSVVGGGSEVDEVLESPSHSLC